MICLGGILLEIIGGLMACLFYVAVKGFLGGGLKMRKLPKDLERNDGKVALGVSERGVVYHNFLKYPHLIISGSTGYGKTNMIKVILEQIRGRVVLIDLKGGKDYGGRVSAVDISGARSVLEEVEMELKERMAGGGGSGERLYVVIDEAAELLIPSYMSRKEGWEYLKCQEICSEIARLGRSFGIHLIYCTQYPVSDVLPRQIKQNAEARITFRLVTTKGSEVALDEPGAEQLPAGIPGRGIYKTDVVREFQAYRWEKGDKDETEVVEESRRHMYEIG